MWLNIFKICIILTVTTGALAPDLFFFLTSYLYPDDEVNTEANVQMEDKSYYFSDDQVSKDDAFNICYDRGASLVSINNANKMATLSKLLNENYLPSQYWWIENDKSFLFHDWSIGQPDNAGRYEDCIHLWYQKETERFQMNDENCYRLNYFICEF